MFCDGDEEDSPSADGCVIDRFMEKKEELGVRAQLSGNSS